VNGRTAVHPTRLIVLGAVVLASSCLVGCSSDRDGAGRLTDDTRDPGYSATDAEIIQTGADGEPRYRLRAGRIEQNPLSLETRIENLDLETRTGETTTWRVVAPRGTLSRDSRRIDLEGGVALEGGTAGAAEPLRLDAKTLQYDLDTARIRTNGEVRLTMQGHALSATGLDANLRTRQVQLRTDVQGRFSR
jgi:lipopolysaccharide export system protein LptC